MTDIPRDCRYYKWDRVRGIIDQDDNQVAQITETSPKRHRDQLGRLLVDKWNSMVRGERLGRGMSL